MSVMGKQNSSSKILLGNFIAKFLPKSGYKGKYSHNEFTFIYLTLEKIFRVKGRIQIDANELALCMSEAGYDFYVRDKTFGRIKEAGAGIHENKGQPDDFLEYNKDAFIFVNVSSQMVFCLKQSTNSIGYQKDPFKIAILLKLESEINDFFKRYLTCDGSGDLRYDMD
ncbi:MAG: hypothetical protein JJE25_07120 [Bacteroidia bacterium]|nr:hypothetical protein [Bacteroidia bacterium]